MRGFYVVNYDTSLWNSLVTQLKHDKNVSKNNFIKTQSKKNNIGWERKPRKFLKKTKPKTKHFTDSFSIFVMMKFTWYEDV